MKLKFILCSFIFVLYTVPAALASDGIDADEEVSIEQLSESILDEIEELFISPRAIERNLWADERRGCGLSCEITEFIQQSKTISRAYYLNCPFHTDWECDIWFRKPHIRETMAFPSRSIGKLNEDALQAAIGRGDTIDMNAEYAKPLVNRYRMLQKAGQACCSEGMKHRLRRAGATKGLIYKFLVDDANFYGFGSRCLMMTEEELAQRYPRTATANAVSDTRDACLCQRRDYFDALLAPFDKFSDTDFVYTFEDGLRREQTVSITNDVQIVKYFLSQCP